MEQNKHGKTHKDENEGTRMIALSQANKFKLLKSDDALFLNHGKFETSKNFSKDVIALEAVDRNIVSAPSGSA